MKFSKLPMGACFRFADGEDVHKKASGSTYLVDGVGPEAATAGSEKVRKASCPFHRSKDLLELGSVARRRKSP